MSLVIREANLQDASILGHIQVTSWRSAFRNIASDHFLDHIVSAKEQAEDWRKILAEKVQVVLVAELGNSPVGYGWAYRAEDKAMEWDSELNSLHLLPEYKRQGIGRKLFAALAKQLKVQGCKSIYVWVLEDNHPARKFYESLGGQLVGKQRITLGDSELMEVAYGWEDINLLELI